MTWTYVEHDHTCRNPTCMCWYTPCGPNAWAGQERYPKRSLAEARAWAAGHPDGPTKGVAK